jgi:hypothetical protein
MGGPTPNIDRIAAEGEYLPTMHGFDEFYGNLYHLNAEEEPEQDDYPKGSEKFKEVFGPRGVLECKATDKDDPTEDKRFGRVGKQTIKVTGPLNRKRMTTRAVKGFTTREFIYYGESGLYAIRFRNWKTHFQVKDDWFAGHAVQPTAPQQVNLRADPSSSTCRRRTIRIMLSTSSGPSCRFRGSSSSIWRRSRSFRSARKPQTSTWM